MAGMQYYFFPTDFYYPRPPPAAVDTSADTTRSQQAVKVNRDQMDEPADHSGAHLKGADELAADKNCRSYKVVKIPALTISHIPTQKVTSKSNYLYK
ncbi:hypothetical protein ABFX02_10G159500 [Erythranthe guttata]